MTNHLWRACGAMILAAVLVTPAAAQQGTQDNTAYGGASGEFLLLGAGARGTARAPRTRPTSPRCTTTPPGWRSSPVPA